jgi:ATP-dependent DNA helicase DinG
MANVASLRHIARMASTVPTTGPYHAAAPQTPALVSGHGRASILTLDGELLTGTPAAIAAELGEDPPLLVHAPATLRRMGLAARPCFDLLELFAFVRPACAAAPTPRGLALALDLDPPRDMEGAVALLPMIAETLLGRLAAGRDTPANQDAAALAARMGECGWGWAPYVLAALGGGAPAPVVGRRGPNPLQVWKRLPEWEEEAPPPPPASHPVPPADARRRLAQILGGSAEERPGQGDYADAAAAAFAPRQTRGDPLLVLAEAGTGTGKTLGYIAPASLWAERNGAPVWISTYTRHLQRQVEQEVGRLHPDQAERRRRVVVRKGRENYLCLLNLEDRTNQVLSQRNPVALIPLALLARWVLATDDGDLQGGDLPGWFAELFGSATTIGLADRRGECIHGACPHYRRCFVEHTIRRARTAELVVANHALVMIQAAHGFVDGAASGGLDGHAVPTRYVFDEGHHLFDAADGAFAAVFSGIEGAELRRWLLGAEGGSSRARGLRHRLTELVGGREELEAPLDAALQAARALPSPGWSMRLNDTGLGPPGPGEAVGPEQEPLSGPAGPPLPLGPEGPGRPNPSEAVLQLLRHQVLARTPGGKLVERRVMLECDLHPLLPGLAEAAARLGRALSRIIEPLRTLADRLAARLDDEAEELDPAMRARIEAAARVLRHRAIQRLSAWQTMMADLAEPRGEPGERPAYVNFLQLDRREAGDRDAGLHRHWLDPTVPFAATLAASAHGLLVTSATLRDAGELDPEASWLAAENRVGAPHLPSPAIRAALASPFDYAQQTRCFVVTDVGPEIAPLAAAYRTLFLAAGGGGLGLFTAISRLQAVHARIAPALEAAGIPLLAQHVDAMDNATLVDVFRTEEDSCLLGTDAMRDGVDVPGRALRLVVFERVPWPRPDILHRERRIHLSGGEPRAFDDAIARQRLRQAFGRLIRAAGDRGVFVLLDRRAPTRLLSALPAGVDVQRVGLAEAAAQTRAFLERSTSAEQDGVPA